MSANRVELIPLAITDLSLKYARRLEGNKIIHYKISAFESIMDSLKRSVGVEEVKANPFETVRDFILTYEPNAEVVLKDSVLPKDIMEAGTGIAVTDMSEKVLRGLPRIRSELLKRAPKTSLLQFDDHVTPFEYPQIRRELVGAASLKSEYRPFDNDGDEEFGSARYEGPGDFREVKVEMPLLARLSYHLNRLGLLRRVPEKYRYRRVSKCSYIAYTYEEPKEAEAIAKMQKDLQILSDRGLILGHLAMPSSMYLADTVGSGVAIKCLFCFVFADIDKMYRQLNIKNPPYRSLPLSLIGIGEVSEGDTGHHIASQKYEIEEVLVERAVSEKNRQAVIDAYLASRDFVNETAKSQDEAFKKLKVETSSVNLVQENRMGGIPKVSVAVDIKVSKKDE